MTVDDAGTIQLTKNTTAAGDSLGILEFHDEDGTATDDAGKFQIKGVRGGDKDAPDLQFIGSDSVGTLTKRLDVTGGGDITFYDAAGNSSFVYDVDSGTTINNNQDARDFTVKSDNNANMLYVDGTNDKVGVGDSSPSSKFTVGAGGTANPAADMQVHIGSSTGAFAQKWTSGVFNSDGNWIGLGLGFSNNYMKTGIFAEAKDANARANLHFALDSDTGSGNVSLADAKMTITYDGNVGIGGTPQEMLDLFANNNGAAEGNTLRFTDTDTATQSGQNSGTIEFYTSDTDNAGVHATIFTEATGTGGSGAIVAKSGAAGSLVENIRMRGDYTVINDGNANTDFQVKSVNQDYMLFVDAASDAVGIGTNVPDNQGKFYVVGSGSGSLTNSITNYREAAVTGQDLWNSDLTLDNDNAARYGYSNYGVMGLATNDGDAVGVFGMGKSTNYGGVGGMFSADNTGTTADKEAIGVWVKSVSSSGGRKYAVKLGDDVGIHHSDTDTTATTQTAIYTFDAAGNTGAKFLVCVTDSTDTERYITELLVTHDGTTAVATEYGQVATDTALATFDVDISGGNVRLLATPASSNSMTFKVMSTQLLA